MPVSYPAGTIAEHLACRQQAVMFDASHLGTVRMTGAEAFGRLQAALTNDLTKVGPGRAQYTHLLDQQGSVVDDIIVWWVADDRFDVMPNASNTERFRGVLGGEDVTATRAVIAVQGPEARTLVAGISPEAARVGRFRVIEAQVAGQPCVVAGTGYTGEDGIEIAVPADGATAVWEALAASGATPAGLGARDTLRLEAALPLHGQELGPGITPLQAGLGWVVSFSKPEGFIGKAALEAELAAGPARTLVGLVATDRRPPRHGSRIVVGGEDVGEITSGNFSPVLGVGIALGFVPPVLVADGAKPPVEIETRGRRSAASFIDLPFVAKKK